MKKEDKELVCKWLDRAIEFATEDSWYDCKTDKKAIIEISPDKIQQFKQDNDLLPKNVSGWYIEDDSEWCVYYDFDKEIMYGIGSLGRWLKKQITTLTDEIPATQQQVEERLFPFFEKTYPKGSKVKCLYDNLFEDINGEFNLCRDNNVWDRGTCIMRDGILAELIEESEVEKLKAEIRKLSDKLKDLGE